MRNVVLSFVIILAVVFLGYKLFSNKNLDTKNVPVLQETSGAGNNLASSTESSNANQTTIINNVNKKSNMITIDTNYGKIVFETYNADAPKTVENFVTLANKGYYNGVIFHRVIKGFMIQGGDPTGTGAGGPGYQFADELNPNTSSYKAGYKKGVVAMANSGPDTNGSQFFIMTEDYPLPNSYTIFGKVVSGQDVVDAIANVKTGANDKPESPVIMKTVSVQ
ncbi:MAG: Peptidyl-prolyl cis-trans isomerase [Parcubacteria group bacterium GW2011_GWF2_40_69]|nr:MAG: Peptidyl-prolyl cis-trans isomerase [Parcubacteria group bacterium GW2011_GWC1_39_12]KKR19178.1 MAG: Peptidyl-prolyl cis-trans isomerase [Parcubacteria group bacterium GW2011_GWF1_39_37]KKR34872.1 MAG: Peptidyl-prolyl cis-trans isomerase [Parcubacteria group bacterium GW2011_GWC2_40_10]KKR52135.1 MAG: Peptidyl-prolyl cis-trans isomerase [Parcubacteria group bacterium GW2011_GWE1_40_20]KKR68641.1 MAG: Peptidyl-prolyl cis-trans isomerase [Parcubacteria group bacterium GW2011_GWF2_40_69]K